MRISIASPFTSSPPTIPETDEPSAGRQVTPQPTLSKHEMPAYPTRPSASKTETEKIHGSGNKPNEGGALTMDFSESVSGAVSLGAQVQSENNDLKILLAAGYTLEEMYYYRTLQRHIPIFIPSRHIALKMEAMQKRGAGRYRNTSRTDRKGETATTVRGNGGVTARENGSWRGEVNNKRKRVKKARRSTPEDNESIKKQDEEEQGCQGADTSGASCIAGLTLPSISPDQCNEIAEELGKRSHSTSKEEGLDTASQSAISVLGGSSKAAPSAVPGSSRVPATHHAGVTRNMATQSSKPITLYTAGTPNGHPISVFLEELKAAYSGKPEYEAVQMSIRDSDIGKVHNQVKSPWFLEINPNGRIPAITHDGFPVFETSAILLYLGANFDPEHKFSRDPKSQAKEYSEELQWLFFAHGGVGPMQGQANHFVLYAPEKIPYAQNRYLNETKRLYSVLESRLLGREYLVGSGKGTYGIADIKTVTWVRRAPGLGIDLSEFRNVNSWVKRIEERPAFQAGANIP